MWLHSFLRQLTAQEAGITLAVDHLVSGVLLGELVEGGLHDAPPQTKHKLQGGLFLNVVV